MAGSAANWFKPASGPLKGQAVYLSAKQQAAVTAAAGTSADRAGVIKALRSGHKVAVALADSTRPEAAAKSHDPKAGYRPGQTVAVKGERATVKVVKGSFALAHSRDGSYTLLGPEGAVRRYRAYPAAVKGIDRAVASKRKQDAADAAERARNDRSAIPSMRFGSGIVDELGKQTR